MQAEIRKYRQIIGDMVGDSISSVTGLEFRELISRKVGGAITDLLLQKMDSISYVSLAKLAKLLDKL